MDQRAIIRLQNDIAAEYSRGRGLPRLIWMPSDVTPQSERQQKFITHLERDPDEQLGADILRTNLEELKTIVIDKLQSKKNPSSDNRGADNLTNIYLICDQCDFDDTVQLSDYLFEQGFEVLLPVFEGDESEVREDHTDKLKYCDAIIIYQGAAKDLWLSSKLRDLRKLPGYDGYQPKLAKAIYAGPPANPQKERLRTREAMVLREFQNFSAESLEPFIAEIESGRQESQQ